MFKKCFAVLVAGLAIAVSGGSVKAQGLDMSQMVQNELNFQKQFYQWAAKGSIEAARWHRINGVPIPFNATTLNQANLANQQAYDRYNQGWYNNSNRTSEALANYSNYAVRGLGPYQGSNGMIYNLPWTHNQYHINQWGQAVPGYNPYRMNVTPYYGR